MINGIVTTDFVFEENTLYKGDVVVVFKEGILTNSKEFIVGASTCKYACQHGYIKEIDSSKFTAVCADFKARNSLLKYLWYAREGEVSKQVEPEVQKLLDSYDTKIKETMDTLISKAKFITLIPKTTPVEKETFNIPVEEV